MDCFATEYYAASKFLYSAPLSTHETLYFEFNVKENEFMKPDEFSSLDSNVRSDIESFITEVKRECQDFKLIPLFIRRYLKIGGFVIIFLTVGVPMCIFDSLIIYGIIFLLIAGCFFFFSVMISRRIKRHLSFYKAKIDRVISNRYKHTKLQYYWKTPDLAKYTISWLEFHITNQQSAERDENSIEKDKSSLFVPVIEAESQYIMEGNET